MLFTDKAGTLGNFTFATTLVVATDSSNNMTMVPQFFAWGGSTRRVYWNYFASAFIFFKPFVSLVNF